MTVKLVLLKSGEDIIADVQEMVFGEDENKRVVGYFLDNPCIVKMRDKINPEDVQEKGKASFQVSLYPWMPLSKDKRIPLTADWVVTMTEPIDNLKEMYIEDIINYGKENSKTDSSDERAEFTESN
jgi:hypothetical protein